MNAWSEEEIQKKLEQGEAWNDADFSANQKEEIEAYKILFKKLQNEPAGSLPYNFSKNVVLQLQNQTNCTSNYKIYFLLVTLLITVSVLFYLLLLYNDEQVLSPIFQTFINYKWPLLFCLVSIYVVQYLDEKLVKDINKAG